MFFKSFYTLLFFIVFSFLFALAALITAFICSPKTKNSTKTTTYECGITPSGDAKINFSIKYYLYAILFTAIGNKNNVSISNTINNIA